MYAYWRTAAVLETFIATKVQLVDQMTMVKCMVTLNQRRSLTNWVVMSRVCRDMPFRALTARGRSAILKVDN